MSRLINTKVSSLSTRNTPPLMEEARGMHSSFLKIGLAAVLVLLLVCSGAAGADATQATITFNPGTGSGSMDSQMVTIPDGETKVLVQLNKCTFTAPSTTPESKFIGWYDGTKYYTDQQAVEVTTDLTLTAQWATITQWDGSSSITSSGYYNLSADKTDLTAAIEISVAPVVIDLNGHVLKATGEGHSVITVSNNGVLNLVDSNPDKPHYFEITENEGTSLLEKWVWNETMTTEPADCISRDSITSFDNDETGGWAYKVDERYKYKYVKVTGGVITEGSGTLFADDNAYYGGGVFVASGTFTMSGGNIVGNSATGELGGGVCVVSSTITFSGGSIAGNSARDGGGVYIYYGSTFTMSGNAKIIGNSASGNGGGVKITALNSMFMMKDSAKIIGNSIADTNYGGGGVCVENNAKFTMSENAKIAGNSVPDKGKGGGVYLESGSFTMSGGSIAEHTVTSTDQGIACGGGVYVESGLFTMTHGSISSNTVINIKDGNNCGTAEGGGVYLKSGSFTMSGGIISHNEAIMNREDPGNSECNGGGVYVAGGTFTMSGGEISENVVESNASGGGGGVCITGGSGHTMSGNAKISGNTVTVVFSSDKYSVKVHGGGGVKLDRCKSEFVMSGKAEITGNRVVTSGDGDRIVTQGGGVYVYEEGGKSKFKMTGEAKVTGNHAEKGGGVYIGQRSTLDVSGTPIIEENTQTDKVNKNNVYLDDYFTPIPLITVSGELKGNAKICIAYPLSGKFGQADGTYQIDKDKDLLHIYTDSKPQFDPVVLENGLYFGGVAKIDGKTGYYISVDKAVKEASEGQTIIMMANSCEPTINIEKKITLDLNGFVLKNDGKTPAAKSVINVKSGGDLTVKDSSKTTHYFQVSEYDKNQKKNVVINQWRYTGSDKPSDATSDNTIPLISIKSYDKDGGWAQYISTDKGYKYKYVTVTGGAITGDKDSQSGGVKVESGGKFTMSGGNIIGNIVDNGGGVSVAGGEFTMSNGNIAGNSASNGGGGVYSSGTFTMSGGNIVGNYGFRNGGGVYVADGTFTMNGGNIVGNTAKTETGGGVYISGGKFTMSGGNIIGNSASTYGGGVYSSGTFTMSSTASISGNNAGSNGGGVYVASGSEFTMSGTASIIGNSAKNGGGVSVSKDRQFTMEDGSIVGNIATGTANSDVGGGGVYNMGTFIMSNTAKITGNSATKFGGGVVNAGVFTMSGGSITGNTATLNGGGVWNGKTFTMTGGTIGGDTDADKNTATDGGGVYVNSGTFTMSSTASTASIITGNTATGADAANGGGGVYVAANGKFEVSGSPVISGNTNSTNAANNVYLISGKTITVTDAFHGEIHVNNPSGTSLEAFGTTTVSTDGKDAEGFISDTPADTGKYYFGKWDSFNLKWNTTAAAAYRTTINEKIMHGTVTAIPSVAKENTNINLTVTSNKGYQLTSLSAKTEGGASVSINDNRNFTMPASNVIVTAVFEGKKYTVTLNPNGGSGEPSSVLAIYDAAMPTITIPTKEGYTFEGYFDNEAGGTQYYNPDGTSAKNWDKDADTTLYAKWDETEMYTVTFNMNGHGTQTPAQEVVKGSTVTKPADPTSDGYTFGGWFTDEKCTAEYAFSTPVTADLTLYALWKANTQPSSSSSRNYGASVWLPATAEPTPTPTQTAGETIPTQTPVKTPTQTPASTPAPAAGILAGLAAAGLLAARMRK